MDGTVKRELYLIRHGESFANLDDYIPDGTEEKYDPLLTETGIKQAECLGRYYEKVKFDAVYSSGLRRAVMTASRVAECQEDKTLRILPELCEVFMPPEYEGKSLDELKKIYENTVIAQGYEDCGRLIVPDFNPRNDEPRYFDRAAKFLDYIKMRYNSGEKIAAVSHAGFMTYILFYLFGFRDREPEEFDIRLSNTGVSKITWFEQSTHRYGDYVIDSINDKSHLADM